MSCANKTAFYPLISQKSRSWFSWQGCDLALLPVQIPGRKQLGTGGEEKKRGWGLCPNPAEPLTPRMLCWGLGAARTGGLALGGRCLSQQPTGELARLRRTKARLVRVEGMFDTYIWLIDHLQIVPFSCSFLPSESLNIIIPTFKWRSHFVLPDGRLWILFMEGS